jgi:hypothetical protein
LSIAGFNYWHSTKNNNVFYLYGIRILIPYQGLPLISVALLVHTTVLHVKHWNASSGRIAAPLGWRLGRLNAAGLLSSALRKGLHQFQSPHRRGATRPEIDDLVVSSSRLVERPGLPSSACNLTIQPGRIVKPCRDG